MMQLVALHRKTAEACAGLVVADGIKRSTERRPRQDRTDDHGADDYQEQLIGDRRGVAQKVLLAEGVEPLRVAAHRTSLGNALGEPAEQRQRGQRGDQRRQSDPGDEQAVEQPARRADEHGHGDGEPERQAPVLPGDAENDGREADDRADGEVDAAGDDDQRHRQGDERDLGRQPALVEQVLRIEELIRQQRHEDHAHHQDDEQDRLLAKQQAAQPSR